MAVDEVQTTNLWEEQIRDILVNINRKFEIIYAKWIVQDRHFEVKFRTQIPRDNEDFNALCDEWVDAFSEVTDSVWAKKISNTGPKIRFRKQYQCWTHEGKVIQKELLFDARKCRATLDIKVLNDNPLSKRQNKHIKLGLNVVVKLNFIHLHAVDLSQPYVFFVHKCKPQDLPTPVIHPNPRLPELVAAMVQNGPNISRKAAEKAERSLSSKANNAPSQEQAQSTQLLNNIQYYEATTDHSAPIQQISMPAQFSMDGVQNISFQNLEPMKETVQQCTQFIITPQFDLSEHFVMCQPVVLDTSQVIVPTQNISSHFFPVISRLDNHVAQEPLLQ